MRADIGTEITLNTVIRIPYRNIYRNTALLISSRTDRSGTVHVALESGYRKIISFLCGNIILNVVYKIESIGSSCCFSLKLKTFIRTICPFLLYFHFFESIGTGIDCSPVLLNDIFTLPSVSLLCGIFHELVSLLLRNDTG